MQGELSRRALLQGSVMMMAGSGGANAAPGGVPNAQTEDEGGRVVGAGAAAITLMVNGVESALRVEPRMTLIEALRGVLGLTGSKIACDRGACSGCTVWLDGLPVCACMLLAIEVGQRPVTTIEGLADGDELHPVQFAFVGHDAMQCGFCTPGMVMSCAALLARTHAPTAEDVKIALSGHLCGCGTYPHAIAATLAASGARKT